MGSEPSFLAELLREHPVGPALQVVGFIGLGVLWFNIDPTVVASPFLKVVWFIAFVSLGVGMLLTHKHAFKIQRRRQTRASARSASPWDPPSGV
jgi:hypothetical protein